MYKSLNSKTFALTTLNRCFLIFSKLFSPKEVYCIALSRPTYLLIISLAFLSFSWIVHNWFCFVKQSLVCQLLTWLCGQVSFCYRLMSVVLVCVRVSVRVSTFLICTVEVSFLILFEPNLHRTCITRRSHSFLAAALSHHV